MPYLHSQHFRETERLIYGWAAPAPEMQAIDPLTGFPNLREFYRNGAALIEDCLASGVPCAVAIVDIDHFQRLNDSHCDTAVAHVLKGVAARMGEASRGTRHLLARLDDEEFGILLAGLETDDAMAFCERLRREIGSMRIDAGDGDFSVTVSIGLAEVCGPETFDNYLNAAEQFLFMAKSYGRNQIFSDHMIALQAAG